jgi:hypothetical protein
MSKNLILVAGYPKSGRSCRLMFEALRRPPDRRIAINELSDGFCGARRRILFAGFAPDNSSDLLPEKLDEQLPGISSQLANELGDPGLLKSHETARSLICLVLRQFDVAVSLAH